MDQLRDANWVLSVGTFLPLAGVLVMLFIPKAEEQLNKAVALITALATLGVGVYTLTQFDYDQAGKMQFVARTNWISVIKSTYYVGIDGISLPLYFLSMVITVLVMIYSWNHIPSPGNPKAFLMLMLVLQTGMAGTFMAQDLILFFVFFELVLLPMYFMIGVWGGENRQYASLKFFLYTMFGSALMLVAFLALFFKTGAESFAIPYLVEHGGAIAKTTQVWIFAGMFVGFAVKVPMFPFHTWLPDAHTQAPTQGSVILAAILLKLGTYGFIRIAIPVLPEAAKEWAPWIGLLAVIGIIYGALGCLAQTDMKRLIAFSSVAHMGFVMLGISTLTSFGMNAAVFGMVAHGLITGMLFFIAGSVKERYHTLEIARLGGMLKQMPKPVGFSVSVQWHRSVFRASPDSGVNSPQSFRPTAPPPDFRKRPSASTWSLPRSAPCLPRRTCCGSTSARPSVSRSPNSIRTATITDTAITTATFTTSMRSSGWHGRLFSLPSSSSVFCRT